MSQFTFFVNVKLVGPYVPPDKTIVRDFLFTDDTVEITDWEQRPTGLNATPSSGSALLSFIKITDTKEANSIILKIVSDKPSSKEAFNKAEKLMESLISVLTISIPGNRYYYKIEAVKMRPTKDFSIPYESAPSDDFFAMDYGKRQISKAQIDFIANVGKIIKRNSLMQNVLKAFSKALKAEIENGIGDEKSILGYYKCIELISQKENTKIDEKQKDYEGLAADVTEALSKQNTTTKKTIRIIRKANQRIREIENSIISRNIENFAKRIGFNEEGIKILKQIIKIRNKVIVHTEKDLKEISQGFDLLHFRECAKVFIKLCLSHKYKVSFLEVDKLPQQKEIARCYRITYQNSALNEKSKQMLKTEGKA